MNDMENSTIRCHNRFMRRRLAGEKVHESPKECFTGKDDEKGYCVGAKYGESCSNNGDADCDVGMFCSDRKVCEHAGQDGDYCNRIAKCDSYLTCGWEDGVAHKCRPYGFYENGIQLGPGDDNDICYSRFLNEQFICEKGPKLAHSNLRDTPGEKCTYSHGPTGLSRCQYHYDGKAICSRGSGEMESEWKAVIDYLKRKPQCHVTLPMAQCDKGREVFANGTAGEKEWHDTWFALAKLHWEYAIEGLLPCMKRFVHPEAFKYQPHGSGSFLTISVTTLLSLLLLFI
jgi:hypothetical protein